ncbi:MAG: type II toxin-antitoxin system VapC family toxin [Candidatus Acidiferrales bacterium]
MIILDTNVLSVLMRPSPDPAVIAWLDRQPQISIWITSLTVFEIRFGLQLMAPGKRKLALADAFEVFLDKIGRRIAPFDTEAASQAGELMAFRQQQGRPGDVRDTLIAGIVLARAATLATRNTRHFEDLTVSVVNPWSQKETA